MPILRFAGDASDFVLWNGEDDDGDDYDDDCDYNCEDAWHHSFSWKIKDKL